MILKWIFDRVVALMGNIGTCAFSTKLSVMKDYPDKMTVEPAADVVGGRRSHV